MDKLAHDQFKIRIWRQNSLQTTQYLENRIFPGHAVFVRSSQDFSTIVFSQKKLGSMMFTSKNPKTTFLSHFRYLLNNPDFSGKSGFVTFPILSFNIIPSFWKILWSVFEKLRTGRQGFVYRTNLLVWDSLAYTHTHTHTHMDGHMENPSIYSLRQRVKSMINDQ